MLDWRVDTFLDVCETLNYTHTAKRLNITQPAVSQHIAWIENQLGTTLFVRTGRSLCLNEAGRLAKEVLQTQKHDEMLLRQEIAALKTSAFTLSIGATLTAGEHLLAHPLALWRKDRPQVKASVSIADTAKLLSLLDKGEIDCALVEGIFDSNKYAWQRWSRERMVCVKGPTNLSAQNTSPKRKTLSFREILKETLIIREEGSGSRAVLEAALARHNLAPKSFERVVEAVLPVPAHAAHAAQHDDCTDVACRTGAGTICKAVEHRRHLRDIQAGAAEPDGALGTKGNGLAFLDLTGHVLFIRGTLDLTVGQVSTQAATVKDE